MTTPLRRVGWAPDLGVAYTRLSFYRGRGTVGAVTGSFGGVDRAGVRLLKSPCWIGPDPSVAVARVSRRLPEPPGPRVATSRRSSDDNPSGLYLRANVGTALLLVVWVLVRALPLVS